jgi:hypothetical protein
MKFKSVIQDIAAEITERCKQQKGCEIVLTVAITPEGTIGTAHKEIKRVRVA